MYQNTVKCQRYTRRPGKSWLPCFIFFAVIGIGELSQHKFKICDSLTCLLKWWVVVERDRIPLTKTPQQ